MNDPTYDWRYYIRVIRNRALFIFCMFVKKSLYSRAFLQYDRLLENLTDFKIPVNIRSKNQPSHNQPYHTKYFLAFRVLYRRPDAHTFFNKPIRCVNGNRSPNSRRDIQPF